jgi:hypothetical protein
MGLRTDFDDGSSRRHDWLGLDESATGRGSRAGVGRRGSLSTVRSKDNMHGGVESRVPCAPRSPGWKDPRVRKTQMVQDVEVR